jgi:hypothetical protein
MHLIASIQKCTMPQIRFESQNRAAFCGLVITIATILFREAGIDSVLIREGSLIG